MIAPVIIIGAEALYPDIELGFAIKASTWAALIVKDTGNSKNKSNRI